MTDSNQKTETEYIDLPAAKAASEFDYVTRYTVQKDGNRVYRAEVTLDGPEALNPETIIAFFEKRYNMTAGDLVQIALAAIATRVRVVKAESTGQAALQAAQRACQDNADAYKAGRKAVDGKVRVSKETAKAASEIENMAKAMGMTVPEFIAFCASKKA